MQKWDLGIRDEGFRLQVRVSRHRTWERGCRSRILGADVGFGARDERAGAGFGMQTQDAEAGYGI